MKNLFSLLLVLFSFTIKAQSLLFTDGAKATTPLPLESGGTGATAQNFMDLTTPRFT